MALPPPARARLSDDRNGLSSEWLTWLLGLNDRTINGIGWDATGALTIPGFTAAAAATGGSMGLPAPLKSPLIDPQTGLITDVWLKWLTAISGRTVNGAAWGVGLDLTLAGGGTGAAAAAGSGGTTTVFVAVEQQVSGRPPDYDVVVWEGNVLTSPNLHVVEAVAEIDGATYVTSLTYTPPHVLEFDATFNGSAAFEHVGFAVDLVNAPWAILSNRDLTAPSGVWARTLQSGDPSTETHTLILDSSVTADHAFGTSHRFRIEWGATTVKYFADGVLKATHSVSISTAMNVFASDFSRNGSKLIVGNVLLDDAAILV